MVASLQEEECFTQALQQQESRNTAAALPLSHEAAMKWFYKDPQGEIQGKSHATVFIPYPRKFCVTQATIESPSRLFTLQVHSLQWRCVSGSRPATSP